MDNHFEERTQQIICITEVGERLALELALQGGTGVFRLLDQGFRLGLLGLTETVDRFEVQVRVGWGVKQEVRAKSIREQPTAAMLGAKDVPVDLDSHLCGGTLMPDDVKLSFRPLIVSRKTEQFKEEGAEAGIAWVRSYFLIELLNGSGELSSIEKLFGVHALDSYHQRETAQEASRIKKRTT